VALIAQLVVNPTTIRSRPWRPRLRWEVALCFVDIGEIIYYHSLSFVFIHKLPIDIFIQRYQTTKTVHFLSI
jgi:hypothetical protein